MAMVRGYSRVPEPPARMMPFTGREYSSATPAGGSNAAGDRERGRRRAVKAETLVLVRGADLAANLAARRQVRVDVRIGDAAPDGSNHLGEVAGRQLLGGYATRDDVCGGRGAGDGAGLRAGLRSGRTGIRRRLAEPDDDAAVDGSLRHVDVGLRHRPLQAAE